MVGYRNMEEVRMQRQAIISGIPMVGAFANIV